MINIKFTTNPLQFFLNTEQNLSFLYLISSLLIILKSVYEKFYISSFASYSLIIRRQNFNIISLVFVSTA